MAKNLDDKQFDTLTSLNKKALGGGDVDEEGVSKLGEEVGNFKSKGYDIAPFDKYVEGYNNILNHKNS